VQAQLALLIASPGPLAGLISVFGLLAAFAWIAWRFGPILLRLGGWCSCWAAWACGSQGGYGYCVGFLVLGTVAWGTGTIWYASRRGRWPSRLSERLFTRLLGRRSPTVQTQLPTVVIPPRRFR
jgi:hypothetical protein